MKTSEVRLPKSLRFRKSANLGQLEIGPRTDSKNAALNANLNIISELFLALPF
jgi:hypothetical protein